MGKSRRAGGGTGIINRLVFFSADGMEFLTPRGGGQSTVGIVAVPVGCFVKGILDVVHEIKHLRWLPMEEIHAREFSMLEVSCIIILDTV